MPRESALWKTVGAHLAPFGRLVRVENSVGLGTPDVAYSLKLPHHARNAQGWLELKRLKAWPRRQGKVLIGLEEGQGLWHHEWAQAGGTSFILCKISNDYLLFPGSDGLYLDSPVDPKDLRTRDLLLSAGCGRKFPIREVLVCLTK